jgi:uncharacterized protein
MLAVGIAGSVAAGPREDAGVAYKKGDYATALRMWRPLAEQGDAVAQTGLALMYEAGQGVTQNYNIAMHWYRKAADQGEAIAQSGVGMMYLFGQGVPKDYRVAAVWFQKAAEQGGATGQLYLGVMYMGGDGVPKDYVAAYMWLNLAAASGIPKAAEGREKLEATMTPAQIAEAQKLAREWKPITGR